MKPGWIDRGESERAKLRVLMRLHLSLVIEPTGRPAGVHAYKSWATEMYV